MSPQHTPFPFKSLLLFVAGAVVLRLLTIAGWVFFPGGGIVAQLGKILIPLGFSVALVMLNQKLLTRDGFRAGALGLAPTPARTRGIFVGVLVMIAIVGVMAAALWLAVPFHYQRGPLSLTALCLRSIEYLGGNAGEELIFRGYLLLVLGRHYGWPVALVITSLLFGLFHLPGLSGLVALKMTVTTFLGGIFFAYGFLLTGTLWCAIGMHVVGNIVLHQVLGLSGGTALLTPVFDRPWPTSYDPAFVVWLVVLISAIAGAAYCHRRWPRARADVAA